MLKSFIFFKGNPNLLTKNASLGKEMASLLTNEIGGLLIASVQLCMAFICRGIQRGTWCQMHGSCSCQTHGPWMLSVTQKNAHAHRWERRCSSEELRLFARGLKGDLLFHSVVMPFLLTKVNWWQSRGEAFGGKKFCWPFSDWIWPQSRIPAVAEMIDYCNDRQNGLLACLNGNKFHQEEGNLTTFWQWGPSLFEVQIKCGSLRAPVLHSRHNTEAEGVNV